MKHDNLVLHVLLSFQLHDNINTRQDDKSYNTHAFLSSFIINSFKDVYSVTNMVCRFSFEMKLRCEIIAEMLLRMI